MAKVTFNNKQSPFFSALRKNIDEYFKENNISQLGNSKLYSKTIILLTLAAASYCLLVFASLPVWASVLVCVVMGFTLAGIGFNVMHDGAHGSYSNNKTLNNFAAFTLDMLGGSSQMWKLKHNVIHHTFTNIEGLDDDIDIKPFMRVSEDQPKYWFHRFQHLYWFVLYALSYIAWVFLLDFRKYFAKQIGETPIPKFTTWESIKFFGTKVIYLFFFIVLPGLVVGWKETIVGYLIVSAVCGFVIAIVFQLAHVVEDANFPVPNADNRKIEEEWAIHQVRTTANFATRSKLVSWFMGGLNFQMEHHLFPKISHIHYPEINKIVKKTCEDFNIKVIEYKTVFSAIGAHIRHLKAVGSMA